MIFNAINQGWSGSKSDSYLDILEFGVVWIWVEEVVFHANHISAIVGAHFLFQVLQMLRTSRSKGKNVGFVPFWEKNWVSSCQLALASIQAICGFLNILSWVKCQLRGRHDGELGHISFTVSLWMLNQITSTGRQDWESIPLFLDHGLTLRYYRYNTRNPL